MEKTDYWMNIYTQLGNYDYVEDGEQKEAIAKALEDNDPQGILKVNDIRDNGVRAAIRYMARVEIEMGK